MSTSTALSTSAIIGLRKESLPVNDVLQIDSWVADFKRIDVAGRGQRGAIVEQIARRRGCSVSGVRNKKAAYEKQGERVLLDLRNATHKKAVPGLESAQAPLHGNRSEAFRTWVKNLAMQFQRNNAGPTVHEHLILHWERARRDPLDTTVCPNEGCNQPWGKIPGYETAPKPDRAVSELHPKGWSLRSIQNIIRTIPQFALTRSRQGNFAAADFLPPTLTTRMGLKVGQIIMIDDHWYDNYVNYDGKQIRPLGLNAMDVLSGCDIAQLFKPRNPDAIDGEKSLNARDTLWLILQVLTRYGFRTDCQTVFVMEGGTASIPQEWCDRITKATRGQVVFQRGEVRKELVKGLRGLSKGNPKHKPQRESWFNILRNRMAMLPMQTGRKHEEAPEHMAQLLRYEKNTINHALECLTPEQVMQLKLPSLPWSQFVPLAMKITHEINCRTVHNLEGWDALGFVINEFRIGPENWVNQFEFLSLPDHVQMDVSKRMNQGELVSRPRSLSPMEVFTGGSRELERLSPWVWHHIIPVRLGKSVTVPKGHRTVQFQDKTTCPAPFVFETHYKGLDGEQHPLHSGQKVTIFLNPLDATEALFCDANTGAPMGLVKTLDIGNRLDEEKLHYQWGQKSIAKSHMDGGALAFDKMQAEKHEADKAHNLAIFEGVSIEEKQRRKQAGKSLEERTGKGSVTDNLDLDSETRNTDREIPILTTNDEDNDDYLDNLNLD